MRAKEGHRDEREEKWKRATISKKKGERKHYGRRKRNCKRESLEKDGKLAGLLKEKAMVRLVQGRSRYKEKERKKEKVVLKQESAKEGGRAVRRVCERVK